MVYDILKRIIVGMLLSTFFLAGYLGITEYIHLRLSISMLDISTDMAFESAILECEQWLEDTNWYANTIAKTDFIALRGYIEGSTSDWESVFDTFDNITTVKPAPQQLGLSFLPKEQFKGRFYPKLKFTMQYNSLGTVKDGTGHYINESRYSGYTNYTSQNKLANSYIEVIKTPLTEGSNLIISRKVYSQTSDFYKKFLSGDGTSGNTLDTIHGFANAPRTIVVYKVNIKLNYIIPYSHNLTRVFTRSYGSSGVFEYSNLYYTAR